MNREIRFRAWDHQKNKWATNNDVQGSTGLEFGVNDYFINIAGEGMARWSFMQFTGLKDKYGKEIYEGDIVRVTGGVEYLGMRELNRDCQVLFSYGGFYAVDTDKTYFDFGMIEEIEVISNIYESPELMEK